MICLWQGGCRELVKVEPFADRKLFLDREECGTIAERRQNSSLLAFISDNTEAQALLPLIMLLNERHIPAAEAAQIVEDFRGRRSGCVLAAQERMEHRGAYGLDHVHAASDSARVYSPQLLFPSLEA